MHLVAKEKMLIGNLRSRPVDLCLRNYPKEQFAQVNNRVSRQHAEIARHPNGIGYAITDLGSTNGIILDGKRLPGHTPWAIPEHGVAQAHIPKSVSFNLRCIGEASPRGVIITRPENHPQIMYALVNGVISIGNERCDLPVSTRTPANPGGSQSTGWEFQCENPKQWIRWWKTRSSAQARLVCRWGDSPTC